MIMLITFALVSERKTPKLRSESPLVTALFDFCRPDGRKLTTEALVLYGDEIMIALTGTAPENLAGRSALAHWIASTILRRIAALGDPREKAIAQVALVADKTLHGMNVSQRVKDSVERGAFTKNEYWKRRRPVVAEIAVGLELDYPVFQEENDGRARFTVTDPSRPTTRWIGPVPMIFLVGLELGSSLDRPAEELGFILEQLPVPVNTCSMASKVTLTTGYAFAERSVATNTYKPQRYTLFRRISSRKDQPIKREFGRIDRLPGDITEARLAILSISDLVISVGGDAGTAAEIQFAHQLGKPVVSIATTGGASDSGWHEGLALYGNNPAIASHYHDLSSPDLHTAVRAAGHVTAHLLFEGR